MNLVGKNERILWMVAAASLAAFVAFAALLYFDSTQILGINRWIKPAKFAISIAIYTATVALLIRPFGHGGPSTDWITRIVVAAMCIELPLIAMQAARGVPSHFNNATAFDSMIFLLMGLAIIANTVAIAFLLRDYAFRPPFLHPATVSGIRAGLFLFLLASLEAGAMIALHRHTVGAPDGGPGLPLVNWSTMHGDLRVAHFFGLHALQALPLIAMVLPNRSLIRALALLWFAVFAGLFGMALAGRPLLLP